MNLLLDTHMIIWALTDDSRLSNSAKRLISDPDNLIYFSMASIWEIALKNFKSPEKCPYQESDIDCLCRQAGFMPLDIRLPHITGLRTLQFRTDRTPSSYDPWDRILLSQAKTERLRFLSHDRNLDNYAEPCIYMV